MTISPEQRAQVERQVVASDRLHAAILADARRIPGFAELARRDALSHHTGVLPASIRLGLLVAPSSDPLPNDHKGVIRVALPSRTPR